MKRKGERRAQMNNTKREREREEHGKESIGDRERGA